MSELGHVGRAATQDDLDAVGSCLASAFADDPLWGLWSFPDPQHRSYGLQPFMRFFGACGIRHPSLRMTAGGEAVTVWTLPGEIYVTPEEEIELEALVAQLFGDRAPEFSALFEQFDENLPEGDYYHLEWWATHRDHAGRGLGSALLHEDLSRIDAEHVPSYLESTNPANLSRYERFGFHRTGEFGPPGGPVVTTMWREAR